MKRIVLLTSALLFVLLTSFVASNIEVFAQDDSILPRVTGERRALLIAISKYSGDNLDIADNDVNLMGRTLNSVGFDENSIVTMKNSGAEDPERLSKDRILAAIKSFAASCDEQDFAFVMISGFSVYDEENHKSYLVPNDFEMDKFTGLKNLKVESLVPFDQITDLLKDCKAQFKALLVDAYPSSGKGASGSYGEVTPKSGLLVFQNCGQEETPRRDNNYGVFVLYFAEGLKGGANGDALRANGRLSMLGAFSYAQGKVYSIYGQNPIFLTCDKRGAIDFEISENQDWVNAERFFSNYKVAYNEGDYIDALYWLKKAVALDSPKKLLYQKELEIAETLAEVQRNGKGKEGDEPSEDERIEPVTDGSTGIDKPSGPKQFPNVQPGVHDPKKNRVVKIKNVDVKFCHCPAGSFVMGSTEDEKGVETMHPVTLTQDFWMMETETTSELWKAVCGTNPGRLGSKEKYPITRVSFNDCQKFIDELNKLGVAPKGYKFSLPTEAQWEYACRAGTNAPYFCGYQLLDDCANFKKDKARIAAVKKFRSNAWGLYDMSGNVWELTLDSFIVFQSSEQKDPCVVMEDVDVVVRGGSYESDREDCRSAIRRGLAKKDVSEAVGFRCVLIPIK